MLIFYKNEHNCLCTKFYFLVSYERKGVISEMCLWSAILYMLLGVCHIGCSKVVLHISEYSSLSYRKVRYTPNIPANLILFKPASHKARSLKTQAFEDYNWYFCMFNHFWSNVWPLFGKVFNIQHWLAGWTRPVYVQPHH